MAVLGTWDVAVSTMSVLTKKKKKEIGIGLKINCNNQKKNPNQVTLKVPMQVNFV